MVAALVQGSAIVAVLSAQRPERRSHECGYEDGLARGRRILAAPVRGSWNTPPIDVLHDAIKEARDERMRLGETADCDERACEYVSDYEDGLIAAEDEARAANGDEYAESEGE